MNWRDGPSARRWPSWTRRRGGPTRRFLPLQLRERYGDPSNTAVYAIRRCVEMKWLDAFRAEHPEVPFDQSVTHFWFGG